jgi:hypothetical protein
MVGSQVIFNAGFLKKSEKIVSAKSRLYLKNEEEQLESGGFLFAHERSGPSDSQS